MIVKWRVCAAYREPMRKAPLPVRDGLNPSRVRLPESGHWATTLDYLLQRFYSDQDRVREKVAAGEVVDVAGTPIDPQTPFDPDSFVFLYRDPIPERRVPFEIEILYRDSDLLVIDKPHFLATMPRGFYIVESALVRLRRDLDLPDLSPLHRLDRVTAGVLMFSLRPEQRGAYQQLFAHRKVTKYYEAVAPYRPEIDLPTTVRSRIVKERGTPTADEVPGEPNSMTTIELLDVRGDDGLLRPASGDREGAPAAAAHELAGAADQVGQLLPEAARHRSVRLFDAAAADRQVGGVRRPVHRRATAVREPPDLVRAADWPADQPGIAQVAGAMELGVYSAVSGPTGASITTSPRALLPLDRVPELSDGS